MKVIRWRIIIISVALLVGGMVPSGIISLQPDTANAQQGPICGAGLWDTRYYPNTNLTPGGNQTTYCITNNQLTGGVNWGTGSPLQGIIGTDFWSASFDATVSLSSVGTYTFTSTYQDGVRVYVNGSLIINNFSNDLGVAQTSIGTFTTSFANQVVIIRLEYVNYTGNAQVSLSWSLGGGTTPITGQPWTAEYFNNRTFTPPSIIGSSLPAGPLAIDWQFNAPASGVIADGFSSRFTRSVNFPTGGVVNFETRADDTVTIRVNGVVVTASAPFFAGEGVVYSGSINVPAGLSTIVVEHTDIIAQAYIFVNWSGGGDTSGGGTVTPAPGGGEGTPVVVVSPTGVVATVNTSVLNFRNAPSTSGQRITQIRRNEQYAVLGQNVDGTWAYLEVNGQRGWSSATYLAFAGDFSTVPILDANGNPIQIDQSGDVVLLARPVGNMRVRECPSFSCTRVGFVPWGDTVSVFGQSFDGRWIRISYTSETGAVITGWSSKIWYRTLNSLEESLPANLPIVQ